MCMRFVPVLLVCSTLVAVANGEAFQYSPGWSPAQTTRATPFASAPESTSSSAAGSSDSQFAWSSLLTSGPIGKLFASTGINMTEKLSEAQRIANDMPWDDRIPMIRDDNFQQLIFSETFATPEAEAARLWFLVVTVTSQQRTGSSAIVDKEFNEAYNTSVNENTLPHVRWGRIDYLNVTRLTTKWGVWRAPLFIVAKDRGKSLRFFSPQEIGAKAEYLHTFLVEEIWTVRSPWKGPWAPGGSREELLDKFAIFQEKLYFYMSKLPRWMYLVLSGGLGSLLLQIFHRKPPTATKPVTTQSKPTPVPAVRQPNVAPADSSSANTKKGGTQRRKGTKK